MITPWSVEARQYGGFLSRIFDAWIRHDVGTVKEVLPSCCRDCAYLFACHGGYPKHDVTRLTAALTSVNSTIQEGNHPC